jgi:hypothetical protein
MNDLILLKLASEAELNVTILFNKEKLEKYTRLVISECANALVDNELYNRHIGHAWREHFGIEE